METWTGANISAKPEPTGPGFAILLFVQIVFVILVHPFVPVFCFIHYLVVRSVVVEFLPTRPSAPSLSYTIPKAHESHIPSE